MVLWEPMSSSFEFVDQCGRYFCEFPGLCVWSGGLSVWDRKTENVCVSTMINA